MEFSSFSSTRVFWFHEAEADGFSEKCRQICIQSNSFGASIEHLELLYVHTFSTVTIYLAIPDFFVFPRVRCVLKLRFWRLYETITLNAPGSHCAGN